MAQPTNIAPPGSALSERLNESLETAIIEAKGSKEPIRLAIQEFVTSAFSRNRLDEFPIPTKRRTRDFQRDHFGERVVADIFPDGVGNMSQAAVQDVIAQAIYDLGRSSSSSMVQKAIATDCFSAVARRRLPFAVVATAVAA